MHMIWTDRVGGRSIDRLGSDHIHLVQKIQHEAIAISECCRGQNTIKYITSIRPNQLNEDKLEYKPGMKINQI